MVKGWWCRIIRLRLSPYGIRQPKSYRFAMVDRDPQMSVAECNPIYLASKTRIGVWGFWAYGIVRICGGGALIVA